MKDKVTAGVGDLIFNVVFPALRSHQKFQMIRQVFVQFTSAEGLRTSAEGLKTSAES